MLNLPRVLKLGLRRVMVKGCPLVLGLRICLSILMSKTVFVCLLHIILLLISNSLLFLCSLCFAETVRKNITREHADKSWPQQLEIPFRSESHTFNITS